MENILSRRLQTVLRNKVLEPDLITCSYMYGLYSILYDPQSVKKLSVDELQIVSLLLYDNININDFKFTSDIVKMFYLSLGKPLSDIDNPSLEVQLMALYIDGENIKYIENPSNEMKMVALFSNPSSFKYFSIDTDELRFISFLLSDYKDSRYDTNIKVLVDSKNYLNLKIFEKSILTNVLALINGDEQIIESVIKDKNISDYEKHLYSVANVESVNKMELSDSECDDFIELYKLFSKDEQTFIPTDERLIIKLIELYGYEKVLPNLKYEKITNRVAETSLNDSYKALEFIPHQILYELDSRIIIKSFRSEGIVSGEQMCSIALDLNVPNEILSMLYQYKGKKFLQI